MCGICGIVSFQDQIRADQLLKMTKVLRHRGPNDEGFVLSNTKNNVTKPFHHDETTEIVGQVATQLQCGGYNDHSHQQRAWPVQPSLP